MIVAMIHYMRVVFVETLLAAAVLLLLLLLLLLLSYVQVSNKCNVTTSGATQQHAAAIKQLYY